MALDYTLDMIIDPASLKILRAAQLKITIAKPVGGASPNVTWLVFDPFEGNKVTWEEQFGMYASPTDVNQNGAVISRMSEVFPAADAAYYSFDSSATFKGPNTGAGAPGQGSFKVNNNMPHSQYPALTFGLEQSAAINGSGIKASPLNAALVPTGLSATFTPITTVYVWLQADFQSGTVITSVNGDATVVQFAGSNNNQQLIYDPNTGRFIPANGKGAAVPLHKAEHVQLLKRPGIY